MQKTFSGYVVVAEKEDKTNEFYPASFRKTLQGCKEQFERMTLYDWDDWKKKFPDTCILPATVTIDIPENKFNPIDWNPSRKHGDVPFSPYGYRHRESGKWITDEEFAIFSLNRKR